MSTRTQFWRINAVDRAGTPWAEITLMNPLVVMARLEYLQSIKNGRDYWVDDPDDEERGDVTLECEEAAWEMVYRVPWHVLLRVKEQGVMGGSRGDGGSGSEGISGYGLSNPVQLTDREREPSFSLRSGPRCVHTVGECLICEFSTPVSRWRDPIRWRVRIWRWKNRVRTLPWGWLGGALLMVWSAALTTWLALEVAAWVLR